MTTGEQTPTKLSQNEIKKRKLEEIKKIVREHIKPEWLEDGIPLDQAIIDQPLETAARDIVDLVTGEKRNPNRNCYPGELTGPNTRWYITKPLTHDEYQKHRAQTDSWVSYLHFDPIVMFNANQQRSGWGIYIAPPDQIEYPGLKRMAYRFAKLFNDCGFPLTQETKQLYLPAQKAST